MNPLLERNLELSGEQRRLAAVMFADVIGYRPLAQKELAAGYAHSLRNPVLASFAISLAREQGKKAS